MLSLRPGRRRGRADRSDLVGVRRRRAAGQDDRARPQQDERRRRATCRSTVAGRAGRAAPAVIEFDSVRPRQREPAPRRQGAPLAGPDRRPQPHPALGDALEAAADGEALALPARSRRRRSPPSSTRRSGRSATSAGSRSTGSPATCSAGAASAPIRGSRAWPRSCPRPIAGTTRRASTGATPRARGRRLARPAGDPRVPRRDARDDARAARRRSRRGRRRRSISIASRSSTRRCTARRSRCWRRRSASTTGLVARVGDAARRGRRCSFRRRAGCSARAAPAFVFDNEAAPHPVDIPEFEIDAQAVTWAQFGEFVEDGGYDERAHWSEDGWAWVEREGAAHAAPRRPDAPRRAAAALRRARARRRRRSPRSTSAGTRPTPGAAGPAGACRARSSGKRRRTRARRAAFAGATCGSGRRAPSGPIRASSPARGATIRCPRSAAQGAARRRRSRRRPSLRSARFRGFARAGTRRRLLRLPELRRVTAGVARLPRATSFSARPASRWSTHATSAIARRCSSSASRSARAARR